MQVSFRNDGTVNRNRVMIGATTLYFSYQTCVGYYFPGEGTVCRENEWGPTTGKYLNMIQPDKKKRIPGAEFGRRLSHVLSQLGKEE